MKPMFGFCYWKWGFWFRLFYKGLWIAVDDKSPPLFSERYGYEKVWRFFGIKIKYLD